MGTWTLGADNATIRNVPEPGPGPIQARRPIPQLSRINAIRFDGKSIYHGAHVQGGAPPRRQLRLQRQLHAVALERRCLEPGRDRVGGQRPAERAEHLRRDAASGRFPASTTATSSSPAASTSCRSSEARAADGGVLGGWRVNAIFIAQSRRAVHGQPQRRSRQHRRRPGAAPRPAARSEPARRRADAGALVRHVGVRAAGAVHVRQRPAQQRRRPGLRQRRLRAGQDVGASAARRSSSSAGRSSTCSTARTSICRTGSSATPTSAGSSARRPARNAVRAAADVLTRQGPRRDRQRRRDDQWIDRMRQLPSMRVSTASCALTKFTGPPSKVPSYPSWQSPMRRRPRTSPATPHACR